MFRVLGLIALVGMTCIACGSSKESGSSGLGGTPDAGEGGTNGGEGGSGGEGGRADAGEGGSSAGDGGASAGEAGSGGKLATSGAGGTDGGVGAGDGGQAGSGGVVDVPGCEDAASCASGICSATRDCEPCVKDSECAEGRVCGSGVCSDVCSGEGTACGQSGTCCNGHCVDITRDVGNCGACASADAAAACSVSELCGRSGCVAATLANLCENARVAVIRGNASGDFPAGDALGAAFAGCPTPPTLRTVTQSESAVVNAQTGQPFSGGGELLLAAGGPYVQWVVNYSENISGAAPAKFGVNASGGLEYQRTSDGGVLVTWQGSSPTHDFLLIQVVRDPTSGTPVLVAYGIDPAGTAAAAWYVANVIVPALATFDRAYYVYEWTDAGTAGADNAAEFSLIASGP